MNALWMTLMMSALFVDSHQETATPVAAPVEAAVDAIVEATGEATADTVQEVVSDAQGAFSDGDVEPLEALEATVDLEAAPAIVAPELAFADLTDEEVFDRAAASIEAIDSLRARFSQFSPSGTEYTGVVNLDRPGRLRFDYDAPNPQLIVATGGNIYVHDSDLETTDTYPVGATPLKFLLDERLDRESAILNEVFRMEDRVVVRLEADDEELVGELALIFGAPNFDLQAWAVIEASGAVTEVTLSEAEYNIRLPGRLFRVPESGGQFLRNR